MKPLLKLIVGLSILVSLAHCQSSSTGGTETGNAQESVASFVGSLFSNNNQQSLNQKTVTVPSQLLALLIREARADLPFIQMSACQMLSSVNDISASASITAGTYGVSSNAVTLTVSDGCAQGGEYASFTVPSHSMTCTDSKNNQSTLTMTDSSGVWRENLTLNRSEIYGTFSISSGGSTASSLKCSMFIKHTASSGSGEQSFTGSCEDSAKMILTQSTDVRCRDVK